MIFDIDTKKEITRLAHQDQFNNWRNNLTVSEFDAIIDELDSMIDGNEVHTSSWMPGNDWTGTVFEPIYTKACNFDETQSGLCFGLFVWYVFKRRTDQWYVMRSENVRGKVYFRKND